MNQIHEIASQAEPNLRALGRKAGYTPVQKERQRAFGQLLREMREEKGISVRRFAHRLGVSATYISSIEGGGVAVPTEEKIVAIARIFGRNPDALLAAAGRVASDLPPILNRHPMEIATFLRSVVSRATIEDIQALTEFGAERLARR